MSRENGRSCAKDLEITERQATIARRLRMKVPVSEIAKDLGITKKTVYNIKREIGAQYKREILSDYDTMLVETMADLAADERRLREMWDEEEDVAKNLQIYDRIFRIIDRRIRVLGLDAPEEIRLDVTRVQHIVAELVGVVCRVVPDVSQRKAIAAEATDILARVNATLPPIETKLVPPGNGDGGGDSG